jgi:hypothetical protein
MTCAFWLSTTFVAISVATAFSWEPAPAPEAQMTLEPAAIRLSVVAQASDLGDMF